MSSHPTSTRQRLITAALELFASQGVTETTTRQISERADVNEVTLFRQFGNKHGLLLAVIEEAAVFTTLGQVLVDQASHRSLHQALNDYAIACLQALEQMPEVVRSIVGEAGQYPSENRQALGQGFSQANRYVAEYFQAVIDRGQLNSYLSAERLASLLNGMLLGYAVIGFTSEFHNLWQDRQDFLENLVTLFLQGATSPAELGPSNLVPVDTPIERVTDLPTQIVHSILQRAKQQGVQTYAWVYVLFGAGLSPTEIVRLERSHYIHDAHQQILQVTQETARQVPINQWILGKRYGSYTKNPLTQWIKSRKDLQPALFLNDAGSPISESELRQQWRELTQEILIPSGQPPTIEQSQQTWCIDMLTKGISISDLQILTGWSVEKLQPYVDRAREKAA
ncbi:MAG: TetR family transcriptional regulator, partial [Phormidesmis sp. CAN_BIN36]|nr:TetR family transcriptional regulator [Phormidesmis sp. CAN_BIN36]